MKERLWFVTNGITVLSAHISEDDAVMEYKKFIDDPDFQYYDYYYADKDDLEDYPDEYDLAFEEGLID